MLEVQKEIQDEQSMKDTNAMKRKNLDDPSLFAAPSDKKAKAEESDSENEEFFDAANEFTNVSIDSAVPANDEKPIGPIDTGYKKVCNNYYFSKRFRLTKCQLYRLLILETKHTLHL